MALLRLSACHVVSLNSLFMAAPLRTNSSPDIKITQRQRYGGGHDRPTLESSRHHSRPRRLPKTEHHREQSGHRSPPRQSPQRISQLPTPMSTPNTSTPSLHASQELHSLPMESTPSGNRIISDTTYEPRHNNTFTTCSDEEAARRVKSHFNCRAPYSQHERILHRLIHSQGPIDDAALDSILTAADFVFFDDNLSRRVRWEWSHLEQHRYQSELIGTTALRPATQAKGGYETLIVLSDPILKNSDYDRRLLLVVFLHELIHCYLFIMCGFPARNAGGHTQGFKDIAAVIDEWAGGCLELCSMKADLDLFRRHEFGRADQRLELAHSHRV